MEIQIKDCIKCYAQYQVDKSFNYNCPIYKRNIILKKSYRDKCIWISVIEKEPQKFKGELEKLVV